MDVTGIIAIAVVCFLIGILLDNLIHSWLNGKEKEAEKKLERTITQQESASYIVAAPRGVEVTSLWRDPATGGLVAQAGKAVIRSKADLASAGQARRDTLLAVAIKLQDWLEMEPSPQLPNPPAPVPASAAPPAAEFAAAPTSLPPVSADTFTLKQPEPARQSGGVFKMVVNALESDIPKLNKVKSIPEQVDEILQAKIIGTPLEKRGVRITEAPDKGLLIWVGMEKYNGLDEVPYDDIRGAIKEAAAEWSSRKPSIQQK